MAPSNLPYAPQELEQLAVEHGALMRGFGRVQSRCTQQMLLQADQIERLGAQVMRLRADLVVRTTQLAWERADRDAMERLIPGLPKRVALARHVEQLLARVQQLMRERLHWERQRHPNADAPARAPARPEEAENLEMSLNQADLVICQTGCLSHGAYWRVQDHCKRTGKACVLVDEPATALRIVRIHKTETGAQTTSVATLQEDAQ